MKLGLIKRVFVALIVAAMIATVSIPETSGLFDAGLKVNAVEKNLLKSGSCGENVRYELSSDGTLTISGSGNM